MIAAILGVFWPQVFELAGVSGLDFFFIAWYKCLTANRRKGEWPGLLWDYLRCMLGGVLRTYLAGRSLSCNDLAFRSAGVLVLWLWVNTMSEEMYRRIKAHQKELFALYNLLTGRVYLAARDGYQGYAFPQQVIAIFASDAWSTHFVESAEAAWKGGK